MNIKQKDENILKRIYRYRFPILFGILIYFIPLPSGDIDKVEVDISPNAQHNFAYYNQSLAITLSVENPNNFPITLYIDKLSSDNLSVVTRDGDLFPLRFNVPPHFTIYKAIQVYDVTENGTISLVVTHNGRILKRIEYQVEVVDIPQNNYPRYRAYWHPEWDEDYDTYEVSFANYSDNTVHYNGEIFENIIEPNDADNIANSSVLGNLSGDFNFDFYRDEIFFFTDNDNPYWAVRRIFYWNETGLFTEVGDVERIDVIVDAQTGDVSHSFSDFHHHTYKQKGATPYYFETYFHVPIPETDFYIPKIGSLEYALNADYQKDRIGFTNVNPLIEYERIQKSKYFIRSIFFGFLVIACLIFYRGIKGALAAFEVLIWLGILWYLLGFTYTTVNFILVAIYGIGTLIFIATNFTETICRKIVKKTCPSLLEGIDDVKDSTEKD